MRHIVCGLFTFIYVIGMGLTDPTKGSSPSVAVKVTHTHEVLAGHQHHHDFDNDNIWHYEGSGDHEHSSDEPKESGPHSHDRLVSTSAGYVTNSSEILPIMTMTVADTVYFAICNESRPKNHTLSSIFRPPINA